MNEAREDPMGMEEAVRAQSISRMVYRRSWNEEAWHWRWECRLFPAWQYQTSLGEPSAGLLCSTCAAIADEQQRYE